MAEGGQAGERLRQYLRQLSPAARALLIAELERALLRGDEVPGGELVLQEVRRSMREEDAPVGRTDQSSCWFFRPIEPFLVDDTDAPKQQGRIGRGSLEPIWAWIGRDLAPAETQAFANDLDEALATDDTASCARLSCDFQDRVAGRIDQALGATRADEKARRRLVGQLGTGRTLDDLRDLNEILKARDTLATIGDRVPGHIRNLADAQLDTVKAVLDSLAARHGDILLYALVLVMSRLAAPWQLIRLAVRAAQSDDATRIAATPYAAAVNTVVAEVERMVGELKGDLKRNSGAPITSLLKSLHDSVRGLRTELDLPGDSPWGRRLAAIRADISSLLKAEIESTPGRVRRLLRPRPTNEIASGSALDAGDVADTEASIELIGVCRHYAGELAISEMTTRAYGELQQYLDTGTKTLLDGLRSAGTADRPFRQSQVDAAVRFCAKVFGQDYASLLTKAAEVAVNSRHAVRA